MNLVLGINTASKETAIALISEGQVLSEDAWESRANESEKLLPAIQKSLEEVEKTWSDLTEIFVVKGPGSYTSLRVGITIANAIAWFLKIPMITTDVYSVWEHRIPQERRGEEHYVLVGAGRDVYQMVDDGTQYRLEDLEREGVTCYGELPDDFRLKGEVKRSFGEALCEMDLGKFERSEMVEPHYSRPPDITTAKKK